MEKSLVPVKFEPEKVDVFIRKIIVAKWGFYGEFLDEAVQDVWVSLLHKKVLERAQTFTYIRAAILSAMRDRFRHWFAAKRGNEIVHVSLSAFYKA